MASSTKETGQSLYGYAAPIHDFEKSLQWIYGDRYYLQATQQDFQHVFMPRNISGQGGLVAESTSSELTEIAKLALKNGELGIAEKTLTKAIRKQKLENVPSGEISEPFFCLAEVLEARAAKDDIELLKKQRLLLQAAALYNFVSNCLKSTAVENDSSLKMMKTISRKLLDIQDNLVSLAGGNPLLCKFDSENKKGELKQLRKEVKGCLESFKCRASPSDQEANEEELRDMFVKQTAEIRNLCKEISSTVKQVLANIIQECINVLGHAPCEYEVLVLGSLAREEMTPYSDLEWAILIGSEEDDFKNFFRNLTNMVHLQIINLGETILPSMGIEALSGEWFYDEITPRGVSFDGFLPQACKTPLGNMNDFELIHSPASMADFQSDYWNQRNPGLAEILLTVSPLESDKRVLVDEYRMELERILGCPCESENCHHDDPSDKFPSRGVCRGMNTLRQDFSRYGEVMTGNYEVDDGKLYDVKKEIYRLTDRVVAGFAKCFGVRENGTFEVLDELNRREIITSTARDNLGSAAAIALKLRISTYLEEGKQGEQIKSSSEEANTSGAKSFYHMPSEKELFHFFFVTIPLYEELKRLFQLDENCTKPLLQAAFFDYSDAVKGDIYCRLLNYHEALDCYKRALEANPGNIKLELRQLRVEFLTNESAEMAGSMKGKIDNLLHRMHQKYILPGEAMDQRLHLVPEGNNCANMVKAEDSQQLLEVLVFACHFYQSQGDLELARPILDRCIALRQTHGCSGPLDLMLKSTHLEMMAGPIEREQFEEIASEMAVLIDDEGVGTRSIFWLNKFGQFLLSQGQYDKAYHCLQRALTMGRVLYGTNPNVNVWQTLYLLGTTSMCLLMYEESKFYFKQSLQFFKSLSGSLTGILIASAYRQMALVCNATDDHQEALSSLREGIAVIATETSQVKFILSCCLYCEMAKSCQNLNEHGEACKSALNAKECLKNISSIEARVNLTCLVAQSFVNVGRCEEAILLVTEGLQELDTQSDVEYKVLYGKCLGEMYARQGLTADAEKCYRKALESHLVNNKGVTAAVVECLLGISTIMLETGKSSEARCKLNEAWKLASSMTNEENKSKFIRMIGECWEKLGDINHARKCYEEVLTECKKSIVTKNVPLFEFDLHVKLGDLSKLSISNSSNSEVSLSSEQHLKAQRIHYDRAGDILRHHSSSGNFNSTTILLFVLLASKYQSIDLTERENLLLEALKISEVVYGADEVSDRVANVLIELADVYWDRKEYATASAFVERSLKIEITLHRSDPYHPHISSIISNLSGLYLESPDTKQLGDAIQCVLEFFEEAKTEEASINSIAKANAANSFTLTAFLLLCLGDDETAETLNQMASDIFDEIKENDELKNELLRTSHCEMMKRVLGILRASPHILPVLKQVLSMGLSSKLFGDHGTGTGSTSLAAGNLFSSGLESALCTERDVIHTEEESSEERSSCHSLYSTITSSDGTKSKLIQEFSEDNGTNDSTLCGTKGNGPGNIANDVDEQRSQDMESVKSKMNTLTVLADTIKYDLKKGDIQHAANTMTDSFDPLIVSVFKQHRPDNIDPAEFFINEALKAKGIRMLPYLQMAAKFPADSRRKAKIAKLRGECNLCEGRYRMAVLSFIEAAGYHSTETAPDPEGILEHSEILIGLAKSHVLCNDVQSAWMVCQEGVDLISTLKTGVMKSQQETELFFLGATCMTRLATELPCQDNYLEKAVSFCQLALASSKEVDQIMGSSDLTEELACSERGEFFALKCEIQLLLVTTLLRLNKSDDAREISQEMNEFLGNIAVVFETFSMDSWPGGEVEFLKISGRLFSWIGRALVKLNEKNLAMAWFSKSLASVCLKPDGTEEIMPQEELLALLDGITAAENVVSQVGSNSFQQTIEFCKQKFLEQNDDVKALLEFFEHLGRHFVVRGRDEEAIIVYESSLTIVECMGNSGDLKNTRGQILLYLAHAHRRQAIKNMGKGTAEERRSAERYYQIGQGTTESSAVFKDVSYASFLCEEERYTEANAVLEQVTQLGGRFWDMPVIISYSSRSVQGPAVRKYVEDHGELVTSTGCLAYRVLVDTLVAMGKKREAAAACEKLSVNGHEIKTPFVKRPPFLPYLLGACHQALLSLVRDQDHLQLEHSDFPLSAGDLAKLYYELNHYELTLEYCEKARTTAEPPSDEPTESLKLSCSLLSGNASVKLGKTNESYQHFITFLELLQNREGILDEPFEKQKAILEHYSFAHQFHVYRSLGVLLSRQGNINAIIKCYEHCLDLDPDYNCDQSLVATLAELYQSKALMKQDVDRSTYTKWMNTARDCFEKLFQSTTELTPFVEEAYGSFLCKLERFEEAISHFANVLEATDETIIAFASEDKPLVGAYLEREIEARGVVCLPLKVLAYYEIVSAYLKLNKVENAQESLLLMEKYVALFESSPSYPLILSMLGYTQEETGNKQKAADIFLSVLEMIPEHAPVAIALETCLC